MEYRQILGTRRRNPSHGGGRIVAPAGKPRYRLPEAMRSALSLLLIGISLLLSGCVGLGSSAIQFSRTDYNIALQKTSDEQMLLNLVRLRYRDQPLFLETSALTTQFSFTPSLGATVADVGNANIVGVKGDIEFQEKPTVTYTPLQGEAYVRRVLSPISWKTLQLLDNVGWRSDRVLRLCVQQLNRLGNAVTASGPTPEQAPDFEAFLEVTSLYQQLKQESLVESYAAMQDGQVVQMLEFSPDAAETKAFRRLASLLELQPQRLRIPVSINSPLHHNGTLSVQTRSLAGVFYFLSQSVRVPEQDLAAGRVTLTRDAEGRIFDWTNVTRGLMRIESSPSEPANAAVKVYYRGSWFYIDDADLDSKSTFSLLGQLFALQSGEARNTGPVLTLPVGG